MSFIFGQDPILDDTTINEWLSPSITFHGNEKGVTVIYYFDRN
jgi:hypothetical protein